MKFEILYLDDKTQVIGPALQGSQYRSGTWYLF